MCGAASESSQAEEHHRADQEPAHSYRNKKIIEYGWDVPATRFVREHVRQMEAVPFDGVTIQILPGSDPTKGGLSLGWQVFSKERFRPEQYEHAIADLKATHFHKFTDNFVQALAMPGVDWFDNAAWESVAHNGAVMAKIARQGHLKGLLFDPENYGSGLWDYAELTKKDPLHRSWEAYVAQVRRRGREFIRALNAEYPDLTILSLFGPALSWGHADITTDEYGLLYAFFDGMCEAATPRTTITDGFEQSYSFKDADQFVKGRQHILEWAKTLSAVPDAFTAHMRAGFGLWMDYNSGKTGWHPDDFPKNHFTPDAFRASLAHALESSDRYVWVYTERARWWDFDVPPPYVDVLGRAKRGL